jgi:hypothetical protein
MAWLYVCTGYVLLSALLSPSLPEDGIGNFFLIGNIFLVTGLITKITSCLSVSKTSTTIIHLLAACCKGLCVRVHVGRTISVHGFRALYSEVKWTTRQINKVDITHKYVILNRHFGTKPAFTQAAQF